MQPIAIGMGLSKELNTAERIDNLTDKMKVWNIMASDEKVFSQ